MIRQTLNFAYYRQNLFRLHLLVDRSQSTVLDVIKGRLVPTSSWMWKHLSLVRVLYKRTLQLMQKPSSYSPLPFRYKWLLLARFAC